MSLFKIEPTLRISIPTLSFLRNGKIDTGSIRKTPTVYMFKNFNTERLILDSKLVKELNGIIKKLNDEVDMLSKQKIYLQSKLKEKNQLEKK